MSTDNNTTDSMIAEVIAWIEQDRQAEQAAPLTLTAESALLEEGIFDSMKILQFVAWLEESYGVTVGVESLTAEQFASPRQIANLVTQLKASA